MHAWPRVQTSRPSTQLIQIGPHSHVEIKGGGALSKRNAHKGVPLGGSILRAAGRGGKQSGLTLSESCPSMGWAGSDLPACS